MQTSDPVQCENPSGANGGTGLLRALGNLDLVTDCLINQQMVPNGFCPSTGKHFLHNPGDCICLLFSSHPLVASLCVQRASKEDSFLPDINTGSRSRICFV